jgi:hypothetical protein
VKCFKSVYNNDSRFKILKNIINNIPHAVPWFSAAGFGWPACEPASFPPSSGQPNHNK